MYFRLLKVTFKHYQQIYIDFMTWYQVLFPSRIKNMHVSDPGLAKLIIICLSLSEGDFQTLIRNPSSLNFRYIKYCFSPTKKHVCVRARPDSHSWWKDDYKMMSVLIILNSALDAWPLLLASSSSCLALSVFGLGWDNQIFRFCIDDRELNKLL